MQLAFIHHDPATLCAVPAHVATGASGMFFAGDFSGRHHQQLLDERPASVVHQLINADPRVPDQLEHRQQQLGLLGKARAQRFVLLFTNNTTLSISTTVRFLGRLHFGGSPIREGGPGNPILSDSYGNRRLQPSTTFGAPPPIVIEGLPVLTMCV
ncbi:MAG: hypothetical protein GAK41_00283 [Burkholderia gladioli]|nr:MAG: hypothetical protein GAK41_00283 [Burkholderia gladioli]